MLSSYSQGWETRRQKQKNRARQKEYLRQLANGKRIKARQDLNLAAGLKNYRKQLGLTQAKFGRELGYSEKSIRDYEKGVRDIPGSLIAKILIRGDIALHSLFNIKPDPIPHEVRSVVFQRILEASRRFREKPIYDFLDVQDEVIQISFELEYFGEDQDSSVQDRVEYWWKSIERRYKSGWSGYAGEEWIQEEIAKQIRSERRRELRQRRKQKIAEPPYGNSDNPSP